MSLLTDAEKAAISADFREAASTFLRPLTVYQEAAHTVIISDPNWNPHTANNQNNSDIQNTPITNVISGRVMWDRQQDWAFLKPEAAAQLKVKGAVDQAVRLKVDASGRALLATAKKVQIDGVMLDRQSEPRPHGLFSPDYWTFYFVRSA